jgi:hypothetical protein
VRRLRRRLVWEAEASVGVDFKWRACVVDCELCGAGVYVCARRVCIVCARISGCAPSAMWVLTRLVEDTTCMCGDWCGVVQVTSVSAGVPLPAAASGAAASAS